MANILIVEDQPLMQRILELGLRNQGYHIMMADNGVEALKCLEEMSFDLALVDVGMPQMDGLTLLRHLRADERYATLPVVMLTANGQEAVRSEALALGADGFLTKPTSPRDLLETIRRFVYAQT
ncbi:MAG: response regulator [Chloroflexi bacterium]|nr:response regulator [Chloroflexota bacterium]